MIIDERMVTFINSMDKGNKPYLEKVYDEAVKKRVPVVRREMQSFLKTLLLLSKPEKILEVGTAVGFSAMLMAEYSGAHITTIENYEKRIPVARENFKKYGFDDRIDLIVGDAGTVLKNLTDVYDLIFIDAAKGQYLNYLEAVKKLMKPGSVLISDNVLQGGEIMESRYIVERRDRTIHKRMREYLYVLKNDKAFRTSIIPLGDGITLSVMEDENDYQKKA